MESEEDLVKKERVVEARARNISHNVRCTECGSQSIEESQADIAILLRKNATVEPECPHEDEHYLDGIHLDVRTYNDV
ncbi:cytochrome c-type biogenesis -like mitochondrial [Olea europaea subsp. europaea]|uniref:Cytochrome c-type biogenesis protein n=1 Tax=Olea europaea subsp. europaea TaxID=158383 RepID=A0A8S0RKX3_OLEEU|nr:cytochrome c-type biogenesis -like mitochondrial [Olea europaea subsp. europaea]